MVWRLQTGHGPLVFDHELEVVLASSFPVSGSDSDPLRRVSRISRASSTLSFRFVEIKIAGASWCRIFISCPRIWYLCRTCKIPGYGIPRIDSKVRHFLRGSGTCDWAHAMGIWNGLVCQLVLDKFNLKFCVCYFWTSRYIFWLDPGYLNRKMRSNL